MTGDWVMVDVSDEVLRDCVDVVVKGSLVTVPIKQYGVPSRDQKTPAFTRTPDSVCQGDMPLGTESRRISIRQPVPTVWHAPHRVLIRPTDQAARRFAGRTSCGTPHVPYYVRSTTSDARLGDCLATTVGFGAKRSNHGWENGGDGTLLVHLRVFAKSARQEQHPRPPYSRPVPLNPGGTLAATIPRIPALPLLSPFRPSL